jgi:peptidoglycan/xylan/chitin deacetylase (PgdA/CDA1 family)
MWKINQALPAVWQTNINKWFVCARGLQASIVGRFSTAILRAGFDALYFSGASRLLRPVFGGVGVILALNRICPPWCNPLRPIRKIGPDPRFLAATVNYLRRRRIDIVSPDEVARRLHERDFRRRFACITLDGAYRDHYDSAWPVFKKHGVPFTVFVPTSFPDRLGELWWMAVAAVVAKSTSVILVMDGREQRVDCVSGADKRYLYNGLMQWLLARGRDEDIVAFVRDLAARYDVDMAEICERACMTWQQISAFASDPLVTIGAQSVNHPILTKLSPQRVERELQMSRTVIEGAIGIVPKHFAYPFGQREAAGEREFQIARDLGYATAMTMRPEVLTRAHADWPTALPRIALDGDFQRVRYLQVAMSGLPEAIAARLHADERDQA